MTFCVGYLAHLIQAVFDNRDERPRQHHAMSTSKRRSELPAPLRLVTDLDTTFIAMNGDVLTTLDYRKLVDYHREQGNAVTIATHKRSIKIDYGDAPHRRRLTASQQYEEKPEIASPVSMGIYVMEPSVARPTSRRSGHFDFPDLVRALLAAGEPVGAYIYDGLWFDIGRHEDYERATEGGGRTETETATGTETDTVTKTEMETAGRPAAQPVAGRTAVQPTGRRPARDHSRSISSRSTCAPQERRRCLRRLPRDDEQSPGPGDDRDHDRARRAARHDGERVLLAVGRSTARALRPRPLLGPAEPSPFEWPLCRQPPRG